MIALIEIDCIQCKKHKMCYIPFTYACGLAPREPIRKKHHGKWLDYKVVNFHHIEETAKKVGRETRQKVYVGEFTAKISRGIFIKSKILFGA